VRDALHAASADANTRVRGLAAADAREAATVIALRYHARAGTIDDREHPRPVAV
jgi:hypothetical protein